MEETWWTRPEQLDSDQRAIVALSEEGSHLIVGPPGSGKTNLLLLRAAYLTRLGRTNFVVLTFNRMLREFLATGVATTVIDQKKIRTYVNWAEDLLRHDQGNLEKLADFEAMRARIVSAFQKMSAGSIRDQQFDCILLDEAQDYTAEEIELISSRCKQIFAVGDDRQRIYRAEGALAALEKLCGDPKLLRHNYRNGLKICRVGDGIRSELDDETGLEASSNYDEKAFPSSVASFGDLALEEQVAGLAEQIDTQLRAYPAGLIGILAPRTKTVLAVYEHLKGSKIFAQVQLQHFSTGYQPFDARRRVVLSTIHGAKGLEFRALHLVAADTLRGFPKERKLAYTAITRAKTSLAIYHNGTLPGYLEQALGEAEPNDRSPPGLDELFR